jgi:hypothetical protein
MAGKHGEKARGGGLTDMDGWSAGVRARSAAEEEEGGESFGGCCGWEEEEEEGKVRGIRAREDRRRRMNRKWKGERQLIDGFIPRLQEKPEPPTVE